MSSRESDDALKGLPSLEQIRAEKARRRLAEWCRYVDASYVVAAHHAKLIAKLEAVERGECPRLMVAMPPRHGKSLTTTVRFPAWWLGRHADGRVIIATHTASLAYDFSRRARNEFTQAGAEVFGVQVASDSSAVDRWDIAGRSGGLVAAGIGGPITGKGADVLVIDDPVKDAKDAESETQRKTKVDWYQQVARTRLHPGGAVVLVTTRWHEADLAGFLLAEAAAGGEQWEQLVLPMVDDEGRALWPERYSTTELESLRKAVGTRAWESLYQQRPSPAEGGILKRSWWRHYERAPECSSVIQSWDMAFKGTSDSDYVVGQVWGRKGADYYLLEQVRGRWEFPATCAQVLALSSRWPQAALKLVEDKANGPAVIAQLRGVVDGLVAVSPDGGKEARAAAVSPLVEAGNVWLPAPSLAPWVEAFLHEATSFPFGANDDQVDAMSQALLRLRYANSYVPELSEQESPSAGFAHLGH